MKGGKMKKDKRGISQVVTTLIIILLSIVALGVVWVVVRNVTSSAQEQVELGQKCREVEITATKMSDVSATTDGSLYSLTLSRAGTGDAISGVKVAFFNATHNSEVLEFGIAIAPLETQTNASIQLDDAVIGANSVEMTAYFTNDAGVEEICTNTVTKTF